MSGALANTLIVGGSGVDRLEGQKGDDLVIGRVVERILAGDASGQPGEVLSLVPLTPAATCAVRAGSTRARRAR